MREDEQTHPFWIDTAADGAARIGLAEGWLESLEGEIVGFEAVRATTLFRRGETFAFVHTARRTLDLRAPLALRVIELNPALAGNAGLLRASPYGRGWLARVELLPDSTEANAPEPSA